MNPMPVLGLYGQADELIAVESVDEAQVRNPHGTWLLFEGAGHGFTDIDSPDYDRSACEDALNRLIDFFSTYLPVAEVAELG